MRMLWDSIPRIQTMVRRDDDQDGVSNLGEFIADTDPGDALDFPDVSGVRPAPHPGTRIEFETSANRRYFIYYTDDGLLVPSWTLATSNGLAGTGDVKVWIDDGSETNRIPLPYPTAFIDLTCVCRNHSTGERGGNACRHTEHIQLRARLRCSTFRLPLPARRLSTGVRDRSTHALPRRIRAQPHQHNR